jgi:hypothetical protein
MKRVIRVSLAALLVLVPPAVAMWGVVPLETLLRESDVIVVAKLTDVRKTKEQNVDYGSGTLTVTEVLRGKPKAGDQLRLEWANRWACPRLYHERHQSKTMIWLLQTSTNGTVSANYPWRVLEVTNRAALDELLRKK